MVNEQGVLIQDWARDHLRMLISVAYRILGSEHDAEEVVQGCFLELLKRQPAAIENPAGYLRHVVTCRCLDQLRQRRPIEQLPMELAQQSTPSPDQVLVAEELSTRLRHAIATLGPRQAEIFTLRYLAEMTNSEIADRLGISANAVAVSLRKSRLELQSVLERNHDEY